MTRSASGIRNVRGACDAPPSSPSCTMKRTRTPSGAINSGRSWRTRQAPNKSSTTSSAAALFDSNRTGTPSTGSSTTWRSGAPKYSASGDRSKGTKSLIGSVILQTFGTSGQPYANDVRPSARAVINEVGTVAGAVQPRHLVPRFHSGNAGAGSFPRCAAQCGRLARRPRGDPPRGLPPGPPRPRRTGGDAAGGRDPPATRQTEAADARTRPQLAPVRGVGW